MASLADLDDVAARLGRPITTAETARAQALLDDASAMIRSYCRRDFTLATTTERFRVQGHKVRLPNRPVVEVLSVATVISYGLNELVTPTPVYSHAGGHEVHLGDQSLIFNGPTFDYDDDNLFVEITYTHGYTEIPADILAVAAQMVVRNLSMPAAGTVDQQRIGPYETRYAGYASQGPLSMSQADRGVLNRYRGTHVVTAVLRP